MVEQNNIVRPAPGTLTQVTAELSKAQSPPPVPTPSGGQHPGSPVDSAPVVTVTTATTASDAHAVEQLTATIWDAGSRPPVNAELARALVHTGQYVAVARVEATVVGVSVGWVNTTRAGTLHSHLTGVLPRVRGAGVGRQLKMHQRGWARAQGLTAIEWTFDPFQPANLRFNLNALGAVAVAYLEDFYGDMRDGLNQGSVSDRLLARWDVGAPLSEQGSAPPPGHLSGDPSDVEAASQAGKPVLVRGDDGLPLTLPASGSVLTAQLPGDLPKLAIDDPHTAWLWRKAARVAIGRALTEGFVANHVNASGDLVLIRTATPTQ